MLDQIKSDRNIGKSEPVILTRLKELADISLQQTVILLEHFVNIAEDLRIRNELTLEDRQALFSEWVPTYKRLAMLQAQQNRLADAFRVAELSKARTLLESASIRQAKQSGVLSPADRAQLDGLEAKLQALDNALGQHREQRRAVIDLLVEKDHIARNLGALNRELMAKYPRYGRLSDVRLIEAKAGQALLPADAALISYLFDGDKLLVFVLSRERLTAKVLSIPHLNKIVRAYRQLLCKPLVAVARDACPPPEGQPLWQQTDGSLLIVF